MTWVTSAGLKPVSDPVLLHTKPSWARDTTSWANLQILTLSPKTRPGRAGQGATVGKGAQGLLPARATRHEWFRFYHSYCYLFKRFPCQVIENNSRDTMSYVLSPTARTERNRYQPLSVGWKPERSVLSTFPTMRHCREVRAGGGGPPRDPDQARRTACP